MPPIDYGHFFFQALGLAAAAVCFAWGLVEDGMLLAPVQAWVRQWHSHRYGREVESRWLWYPLWGCYKCVAGQWAFWGYIGLYWHHYHPLHHLFFTSFTIIAAVLLRGLYQWSQSQN